MLCMILFYPIKNLEWVLKRLKVYIYLFWLLEYKCNIWVIAIFLGDPGRFQLVHGQACHDSVWSCVSQTPLKTLKQQQHIGSSTSTRVIFEGKANMVHFQVSTEFYKLCLICNTSPVPKGLTALTWMYFVLPSDVTFIFVKRRLAKQQLAILWERNADILSLLSSMQ